MISVKEEVHAQLKNIFMNISIAIANDPLIGIVRHS